MPEFSFTDGILSLEPFDCICGRRHEIPIRKIISRPDAISELAATLDELELGREVVLVCDENTWEVAGAAAEQQMRDSGRSVRHCRFPTREWVHPDERAVGALMMAMEDTTNLLVVAGSGCLTDLTRFVGGRTGVPFVSVATAPSMDGYASPGAPMTHGGYKRTINAAPAAAIIADADILASAPPPMIASGFGDTIAKLVSQVEWKLSHLITGEYYCPVLVDLVGQCVDRCVAAAKEIADGDRDAVALLTEALLISGIGMLLAGNSRPASGAEHSLSHYWEMKAQIGGHQEFFHGTKAGVATTVMAAFMARLFDRDPRAVDLEAIRVNVQPRAAIEAALADALGPVAEPTIEAVTRPEYLEWDARRFQIDALQKRWPEITALARQMPSPGEVVRTLRDAGAPALPREIDVGPELLRETLLLSKEVRIRYSLLRVAETLGWLPEITEEVVQDIEALG